MSYIIKPALNLHVNWMQPADLDQVIAIEKSVFAQDRWTRKQFCRLLQDGAVAMVCWRPFNSGRQVLGYMVYENVHRFHFELINLAVAPAYQNHGIGRRMMEALQGKLSRHGRRSICVNVWEFDAGVVGFFRANGFLAVRVIRQPVPGVEGDAYRMVYQPGNKE